MVARMLIVTLATLLLAAGCDRSDPTAAEATAALGMLAWSVRLPTDLSEHDQVGIVLRHADGRELGSGGGAGVAAPNEVVRVLLWPDETGAHMRWAVVSRSGTMRGMLSDVPTGIQVYPNAGRTIGPEDLMIKGSEAGSVSGDNALEPGEYGYMLVVQRQ